MKMVPRREFALIAMGKMGAGELNYSSDIDFSVFFDAQKLARSNAREPRVAAVRWWRRWCARSKR
jgi:glutamate-ammonia-ligase adenylyltransferase